MSLLPTGTNKTQCGQPPSYGHSPLQKAMEVLLHLKLPVSERCWELSRTSFCCDAAQGHLIVHGEYARDPWGGGSGGRLGQASGGQRVIILSTCLCYLVSHTEEHSVVNLLACLLTVIHMCDTLKTTGSSWLAAVI